MVFGIVWPPPNFQHVGLSNMQPTCWIFQNLSFGRALTSLGQASCMNESVLLHFKTSVVLMHGITTVVLPMFLNRSSVFIKQIHSYTLLDDHLRSRATVQTKSTTSLELVHKYLTNCS